MIQEAETLLKYGYLPMDLLLHSGKAILAACDDCGKIREMPKYNYRALCKSCVEKGNQNAFGSKHLHTDEHKAHISAGLKGEKHYNYGKRGEETSTYKGGKKLVDARHRAKRRELGFKALNSYFEDCEGHHITHTFVIYIPKGLHKSVWHNLNTGQGMEVINALALDFLVNGF